MKVQYYMLSWHLKWRGLCESSHWTVSHPPQPTLVNKVPYPYNTHHHRHKAKYFIYLTSRLQFLGSLWNYLKKKKSFFGNQGSFYPPDLAKLASHSPCSFSVFLSTISSWPNVAYYVLPLGVRVCEINKLISVSSA